MSNHLNQFQAHVDTQTAGLWNMFFPERMTEEMAKEVKDDIIVHLQNILNYRMPQTKNYVHDSSDMYVHDSSDKATYTLDQFQAYVRQKLNELPDSVQTKSGMRKWRDALEGEWNRLINSRPYYGPFSQHFADTKERIDMKKQIELHMSAILHNVKKFVKFLESVHEPVQYLQFVHEPPVDSKKISANLYFVQCPLPISCV